MDLYTNSIPSGLRGEEKESSANNNLFDASENSRAYPKILDKNHKRSMKSAQGFRDFFVLDRREEKDWRCNLPFVYYSLY